MLSGASEVTAGVCAARIVLVGARTRDGELVWAAVDTEKPTATVEPISGTDLVADVMLEDADRLLASVEHSGDLAADLVGWVGKLVTSLTTPRGSAMLRTLTVACMEHEDTAVKLRAGFSAPLHDSVRARLLAEGVDAATAESAADAIVGGVVYPILSGAQRYSRRRAEHTTRLIVAALTAG
ncbi:TetR/AcrR family transcriptional regulator C-terminal ligand-binding domain-containing protein [Mycobacterium avium]|uniref:TetR/AcrR family transcriptional regulator C-terminal ligand-binding domain-containing protein n=1 Tax=Mycobacterium avium TaxID=1764 RepID=UPI003AFAE409